MKSTGIILAMMLTTGTVPIFADAQSEYEKCIAKIPKEKTTAEKHVEKNKCKAKANSAYYEQSKIDEAKREIAKWIKKDDLTCDKEYDKFKILGEIKYRKWKHSQQSNADICIELFKDPVWTYKGKDRDQRLLDWLIKYEKDRELKAVDAKSKSTGKTIGKATTEDLEELEKRLTKKLKELEEENKKLKEEVIKQSKKP